MPPTRKAVAAADAPAKKKAAAIAVAKPDTGMVGKSWLRRLYRPLAVVAVAGACGLLLAFIGTGTPAGLAGWLDGLPTERWLTPAVALLMLPALALWWHLVWALEADIKDEALAQFCPVAPPAWTLRVPYLLLPLPLPTRSGLTGRCKRHQSERHRY